MRGRERGKAVSGEGRYWEGGGDKRKGRREGSIGRGKVLGGGRRDWEGGRRERKGEKGSETYQRRLTGYEVAHDSS